MHRKSWPTLLMLCGAVGLAPLAEATPAGAGLSETPSLLLAAKPAGKKAGGKKKVSAQAGGKKKASAKAGGKKVTRKGKRRGAKGTAVEAPIEAASAEEEDLELPSLTPTVTAPPPQEKKPATPRRPAPSKPPQGTATLELPPPPAGPPPAPAAPPAVVDSAPAPRPEAPQEEPPGVVAQADTADASAGAPFLDITLKAMLLVPSGNTADAVASADAAAQAARTVFGAGALALRYNFPWLERRLGLSVESGYMRLSGSGKRGFANDPDFGPELSYAWKMDAIPVLAGFSYRLPLPLPVAFSPSAGFAAVHVTPVTTYQSPTTGTQVTDAPQPAWALGFYAGLEAALPLGPGALVGEVRYTNARTDLDFRRIYNNAYNAELGDVEGTNVLVGYRYSF